MFISARQALRAATELQRRLDGEELPRGVGIGLDAGEAIPVDDGYRGTSLKAHDELHGRVGRGVDRLRRSFRDGLGNEP